MKKQKQRIQRYISLAMIFFILFAFFIPTHQKIAKASEFNQNYILSDYELFNYQSMTLEDIQEFLEKKSGSLKQYHTKDIDGNYRSAAEIIYNASQKYFINPQYLLVLLQKEQSLIEDPRPTDYQYRWATGFARCDSCDPEDPIIAAYGGFVLQVDRAAWRNRYYVEHPEEFFLQLNGTYTIDEQTVTMRNQATLNLYTYTPHIHGNYNFWKLWQEYFVRPYPDGSLLQVREEKGVWLIQRGKKRPFLTKTALTSRFNERQIITVEKNDLDTYDIGKPILFSQYSLVESPKGTVYLIVDDTRRGFRSSKVFKSIGFQRDEVISATWEDLSYYTEGEPITEKTLYPAGALLQDSKTGGVFYVENGEKYPIWSKEILKTNFKSRRVIPTDPKDLASYSDGNPIKFKDGTLVTSSGYRQVFVISNGYRHPFQSKAVFDKLGYKWEHILYTNDRSIELHPLGTEIVL